MVRMLSGACQGGRCCHPATSDDRFGHFKTHISHIQLDERCNSCLESVDRPDVEILGRKSAPAFYARRSISNNLMLKVLLVFSDLDL